MTQDGLSGDFAASPFHEFWASRPCATAWQERGRLLLPVEVMGYAVEAAAFGATAAFADLSNRTVWRIEGPETIEFLGALLGESPNGVSPGRSRPALWCEADGAVRGSGHLAVESSERAVLVSAVPDAAWIDEAAEPFEIRVSISALAGVRLAGPQVEDVLAAAGIRRNGARAEVPGLGAVTAIEPHPSAVDLWCGPDEATALAWVLERAGACPAGSRALETWRIATGLLAAYSDWCPVQSAIEPSGVKRRPDMAGGGYLRVAWDAHPPPEVHGAVFWPATAQHVAILWAPQQNGRQPPAPGGGVFLGQASTD